MVEDIFLCFGCGKRNRVAQESQRAAAKCGKCGESLFPGETATSKTTPRANTSSPRPPLPPHSSPPNRSKSGVPGLDKIFWLSLIAFIGWVGFKDFGPKSPTPKSTQTVAAPQNLPQPVMQAPGIMWSATGRRLEAPLRIKTSKGADYYVKLVDATTGAAEMTIFVKGGLPLDVKVPPGSYRFRYASGVTWRGEHALFGPGNLTSYNEAEDRFDFVVQGGYINGYTVELIRQTGGNLSTRSIPPSQF